MGNYIVHPSSTEATGKVILSDGTVFQFDKPLTVAELMLDYPQQVVVEFRPCLMTEKRPTPLPADNKLDVKKLYLMLPMKRGKPAALTSEEARRVVMSANSVLRSRFFLSSSRFLPLLAKTCSAVTGEKQRFVEKEHVERPQERACPSELLHEIFEVTRPEYLSRQVSGKAWKPNLDTITEKKQKISHWLFMKWEN